MSGNPTTWGPTLGPYFRALTALTLYSLTLYSDLGSQPGPPDMILHLSPTPTWRMGGSPVAHLEAKRNRRSVSSRNPLSLQDTERVSPRPPVSQKPRHRMAARAGCAWTGISMDLRLALRSTKMNTRERPRQRYHTREPQRGPKKHIQPHPTTTTPHTPGGCSFASSLRCWPLAIILPPHQLLQRLSLAPAGSPAYSRVPDILR